MVNTVTHANGTRVVHGKDSNDMARPASITLQRVSDSAVLWQTGAYAYDGVGNVKTLGSDWFTYDGVTRLTVGTSSAGAVRQCTSYNAFGALTGLGSGTTTCTPSSISVDAATNRMASPVTYDAAGNMTAWGGNTYSWTRDNQMLTTTGTGINRNYAYTADGERVLDRNNLDSTRTLWIRDLSGKVLREYLRTGGGVWGWSKDYVYREGLPVATIQPPKAPGSPLVKHLHLDHLGTVRRMTDTQATPQLIASASRDFYPFGLEATTTADTERLRFTGHQRDTQGTTAQADDVDYMHARYYNPTVGRFLSVDPGRDVDPTKPQSWNMYAYVRNNPVNVTDPDGRLAAPPQLLWGRLKHWFLRHVKKDRYLEKSKFITNDPKKAQKLMEKTVREQYLVRVQDDGRKVYERQFTNEVGTQGEKTVRVITEPVGGGKEKVITGHPIRDFLISLLPGLWVKDLAETAGQAAMAGAEKVQDLASRGAIGQHQRELSEAEELEGP